MRANAEVEAWAQAAIHEQIDAASEALSSYCGKPRSTKRLHATRKALARLRAALEDLGPLAGVAPEFLERVHELHRRAGKVRDADVLLERIAGYAENAFGQESGQLQKLRTALRRKRKRGRRKLRAAIASTAPELRR